MGLKHNHSSGFTIVEIGLVMLITGIMMYMISSVVLIYIQKSKIKTTEMRLEHIEQAIDIFLEINGRYPCAAPLLALQSSQTFGYELGNVLTGVTCETAANTEGTTQTNGAGGRTVRLGAVPTRTLGLDDSYQIDAWGNKFTYAITEILATDGGFDRDLGDISVRDSNNNPYVSGTDGQSVFNANEAHYVVISHGEDGAGALGLDMPAPMACNNAATIDGENCDGDADFVVTILSSYVEGANYYDDFALVKSVSREGDMVPEGAVAPFNLNVCPPGWTFYAPAVGREVIIATYDQNYNPFSFIENYEDPRDPTQPDWAVNDGQLLNGDQGGFSAWITDMNEHVMESPQTLYFNFNPTVPTTFPIEYSEFNLPPAGAALNANGAHEPLVEDNRQPYIALNYCCREDTPGTFCP